MISVIIVQYNGREFIDCLMDSLEKQTLKPDRLIIVDNGEQDCRESYLSKNLDILYIRNKVNKGFPSAVNTGIRAADGGFIVLLNNDTYLAEDFIENAVLHMKEGKAEFFAPLVLQYDTDKIDSAGDIYGENIVPVKRYNGIEQHDIELKTEYVEGFSMSACYFKKKHFSSAGMLDESFFLYFEDVDFSLRAAKKGFRIEFTPDTIAWHYVSAAAKKATGSVYSPMKVYYESRNRILLIRKHRHGSILSLRIIISILKTILFHLMRTGYWKQAITGTIRGFTCTIN